MKNILPEILEKWAELYKPLSHDPLAGSKQKTFYLVRCYDQNASFVRNVNTAKSPCMAYSVLIDAGIDGSLRISYNHAIYLMYKKKASSLAKSAVQDDEESLVAAQTLDQMAQDLLLYLSQIKDKGINPITSEVYDKVTLQQIKGLDIAKAEWRMVDDIFSNAWYVLILGISQVVPRILCIQESNYNKEQTNS